MNRSDCKTIPIQICQLVEPIPAEAKCVLGSTGMSDVLPSPLSQFSVILLQFQFVVDTHSADLNTCSPECCGLDD